MTSEPNSIELFLHLTGVIGTFVGFGALVLGTMAMRRTRMVDQVGALAHALTYGRRIGFEHVSVIDAVVVAGVVMTAITGVHMAIYTGDWRSGWVEVAVVSFVLLAPIGPLVINPRLHAVAKAASAASATGDADDVSRRLRDPVLNAALRTAFAVLVGIVFLMAVKPSLVWSVFVMAVAIVVGLLAGLIDRY